jgi:hypothetical protein
LRDGIRHQTSPKLNLSGQAPIVSKSEFPQATSCHRRGTRPHLPYDGWSGSRPRCFRGSDVLASISAQPIFRRKWELGTLSLVQRPVGNARLACGSDSFDLSDLQCGAVEREEEVRRDYRLLLPVWSDDALHDRDRHNGHRHRTVRATDRPRAVIDATRSRTGRVTDGQPVGSQRGLLGQRQGGPAPRPVRSRSPWPR